MPEVYTEQGIFQLGLQDGDVCQAKRPTEQSLGSGQSCCAPGVLASRSDPAPRPFTAYFPGIRVTGALGFPSCDVNILQWGLRLLGQGGREVGPRASPHFLSAAALIGLVEQCSWLDLIQRNESFALKKFRNHEYQDQQK